MAPNYPETEKSERMTITRTTVVTVIGLAVILVFSGELLFAHSSGPLPKPETIKEVANEQDFKTILDNAGQKMIVFDLYASWCAPCRALHPTLEALAVKYAGKVDFYRINVDDNPRISSAFGTNGIPHVVFVKDNKAIAAIDGLNPSSTYEKVISACASTKVPCNRVLQTL